MKKITLALLTALTPVLCMAQSLTEKKGIRLYEHHSSSMNMGAPFGNNADGSKSGYDFVKHAYHGSFDPSTFGAWNATEVANIDMVEHNGPFGNGGGFGFTSATSTIWSGSIKGNALTTFVKAPAGFGYDTVKDVAVIKKAHPATGGGNAAATAVAGDVYISKIRGTNMYVALKITSVHQIPSGYKTGDTASVYFDFDYKYGTYVATGVETVATIQPKLSIAPNPCRGSFEITGMPETLQLNNATVSIADASGKIVYTQAASVKKINHRLAAGLYIVVVSDGKETYQDKLVVTE